ncbi:MAG: DUF1573 domain-containing protein [Spirochaetales bacterium]|nr:DUF1573 domain-containing protein [Spirochaetales bacterium]
MKNRFFYSAVFLSFILCITSGCNKAKLPGIEFSSLNHDFGDIEQGARVEYAFEFTNTGTDMLKIIEVKSTCGCTIPGDYSKEVAAGKTGRIPVVFDSKGFKGEQEKVIRVTTNIPNAEPYDLTLKARILIYIVIDPTYIFLGNTVLDGPPIKGRTVLRNYSDIPLEIKAATLTGKGSKINFEPLKEGFEYIIWITESGPFTMGQVKEMLTLTIIMKEERVYNIPYIYNGTPEVQILPEVMTVFPEQKNNFTKIFSVISNTDILIEILNPKIYGKSMSFIINEFKPKKGFEIKIFFDKEFVFPENDTYYFSFDLKAGSKITSHKIPIQRVET